MVKVRPIWLLGSMLFLAGCHTDMWTQAKVGDYDEDETGLFKDGTTARPLVAGTIPRGWARSDDAKSTGYDGNKFTNKFPKYLNLDGVTVDSEKESMIVLKRGQERFNVVCLNCHGAAGDGKGMITQRGLILKRPPATYHTDRLRKMPVGYFYDVMTSGHGIMFSMANRVEPDDRWAIVAYIRALQMSQDQNLQNLSPEDQAKLQESLNAPATTTEGGHE